MTREEAKEFLPIIQGYAEGKTIQFKKRDGWRDMIAPNFSNPANYYRIKPDPEHRPFKNKEECWNEMQKHQPFGWVIDRLQNFQHIDFVYSCDPDNGYGVSLSWAETGMSFEHMFKEVKFADGTLFGIQEE